MNVARIMFCLTILLTAPIECFVARDLIIQTFFNKQCNNDEPISRKNLLSNPKFIVTFSLVVITCLVSFSTDCLSIVLELNVRFEFKFTYSN